MLTSIRFCNSLSSQLHPRPHNFRSDFRDTSRHGARYYSSDDDSDIDIDDFFALGEPTTQPNIPYTITGQCSFCMTEYTVASSKDDSFITTWQNLGPRHLGPVFRAIAGSSKVQDCKIVNYQAGYVRRAYWEGDERVMIKYEQGMR
jgi:hypothetical protein